MKFEIITPPIMAGADRNKPELREQSIKGLLRWWFRFYKGGSLPVQTLKQVEGEIFGSQELASRIKLKITNKPSHTTVAYLRMNDKSNPNINRKALSENQSFDVEFRFLNPFDEEKIKKGLEETMWFLSNFGGLGARWRRGFGSVQLENTDKSFNEIAEEATKKLNDFPKNINQNRFMSLSNTEIYFITKKDSSLWKSWSECMNDLRDNFYRKLKRELGKKEIKLGRTSPLIIQIKKAQDGYCGVILIWKRTETKQLKNMAIKSMSLNYEKVEIK